MSEEDYQATLLERDLARDQARLLTEEAELIYRLGWHAGFATAMEMAQDIVSQEFRKAEKWQGK